MKKKTIALTSLVLLLSLTFAACAPAAVEEPAEPVAEVEEAVAEVEEPATEVEEPAAEIEEPTTEDEKPVEEPAESAPAEEDPDSRMAFLSALEGRWIMTFPSQPGCTETMTFNSDMTFAIDGNEEHIEGMYGLDEEISESGRARFWMLFTSDNGGADCNGVARDDSGAGGELFIEFSGASELQFFMQPSGGEAQIIYTR